MGLKQWLDQRQIKLQWDGIEWGEWWYLYWWNWLPKNYRYIGVEMTYYDGPHWSLGLWWFNWSWRMPWNDWNSSGFKFSIRANELNR